MVNSSAPGIMYMELRELTREFMQATMLENFLKEDEFVSAPLIFKCINCIFVAFLTKKLHKMFIHRNGTKVTSRTH